MDKMITTSNTDLAPLKKDGVKEKVLEDGTVVLISTKPLKTISTSRLKLKTRIEGPEVKSYYPPLTTTLMNQFPRTARGKKARDRFMEEEADKKRLADGVPPVLQNKGKKKTK